MNVFADQMKATLEEAKSVLTKSKDEMARYYNQRRTPAPVFNPGDKVFLDASDIHTTQPSKKLSHRRLGPYPVSHRRYISISILGSYPSHFINAYGTNPTTQKNRVLVPGLVRISNRVLWVSG